MASRIERRVAALRSGRPRKEDERRTGRFPKREQRPEIRILRHQHAIFFRGELEDRGIVRGLQTELADMYRVMADRAERPSANRGANALSTRNFRPRRPVEAGARQLPR